MVNYANVNVVSFNVNGLRNEAKRRAIFNYLKYFNSHIIMLQETHSSQDDETVWSNEWDSKIYFCHGTKTARGVLVMISRDLSVQMEAIRSVQADSRFLKSKFVL